MHVACGLTLNLIAERTATCMDSGTSPPSHFLSPLALTESGRPQLKQQEIEFTVLGGVDLELGGEERRVEPSRILRAGTVHLTSHRILWVDDGATSLHGGSSRRAYGLLLAHVKNVEPPKKNLAKFALTSKFFSTPRMHLTVAEAAPQPPSLPAQQHGSTAAAGISHPEEVITLVFRGPAYDTFVMHLSNVLKQREWENDIIPVVRVGPGGSSSSSRSGGAPGGLVGGATAPRVFNPSMAGITGIIRREEETAQRTDKSLHAAFADLNALMDKAKEMVKLAERMQKRMAAPSSSSSSLPSSTSDTVAAAGGEEEEVSVHTRQDMQDWMLSVGIMSPVTKESAGALYHQQLARELSDFVSTPLRKSGGVIAVVDVYCMYNRARGTELISPEDMIQACTLWERLPVPVRLRKFDSGVLVIQARNRNEEELMVKILSLASSPEVERVGMSAVDASRVMNMAPALAKEELLVAEGKGWLCRDDGPDGLRFYRNFFTDHFELSFGSQ